MSQSYCPSGRRPGSVATSPELPSITMPRKPATMIQIIATDRPGLLYSVASVLSEGGCNIEVVMVDTQGRKAIDVFYVTPKLMPEAFPKWTERLSSAI